MSLVWSAGGRLLRGLDRGLALDSAEWRIPIAAIREILFKDSGLTAGHLHLVIGDAEVPKNTQWSVLGRQWTILFQPGKQAKAIRELHGILERALAFNRQTGIDPTKARLPYAAEAKPEQREDLADALVRQPTTDAPPSDLIALAKERPNFFAGSWSDLESLPDRLQAGEGVRLLAAGTIGMRGVLLLLTDRRVLVHHNNQVGTGSDELPLAAIESVTWKSSGALGMLAPAESLGTVAFHSAASVIEVKVQEPVARAFIDGVGAEQRLASAPSGTDVVDQAAQSSASSEMPGF
ncbi:hypothetical protein G5V59_26085 [Nocardioides sp. W3-2-3]|uniref:hypothetical protein n=1 Tax=Nocardioides convexus TaxID=2712224 RepID=UPI0024187D3C|nr:hypothetical protein [Nocardioides convexus]NHA01925.1 hypothetical protein [Nocardioides convexus]